MKSFVYILLVLSLSTLVNAQEYGDIIITNVTTWSNESRIHAGNITITTTGNLTLDNVTLKFNGNYGIKSDYGALTIKNNSFISVTNDKSMWTWIYILHGHINISNSVIERVNGTWTKKAGIHLEYPQDSVFFENITVRKYGYSDVYGAISVLNSEYPVNITNSIINNTYRIQENTWVDIYYINSGNSGGLIYNNTFIDGDRALQMTFTNFTTVSYNKFINVLNPISFFNAVSYSYLGFNNFVSNRTLNTYTTFGCNKNCSNNIYENNIVNGYAIEGQEGTHFNYGSKNMIIRNNIFRNISHSMTSGSIYAGMNQEFFNSYNNTVIGSELWGDEYGYAIHANHSVVYSNNFKNFSGARSSCIIPRFQDGLQYYKPNNITFINNTLDKCYYGISLVNSSELYFIDNKITNSTLYDIKFLDYNTKVKFINNKLNESKINFTNGNDTFDNYFYADILVRLLNGTPASGATITLYNEINNASYPSINRKGKIKTKFITGTDGHTIPPKGNDSDTVVLMAYTRNKASQINMSWTICAEYYNPVYFNYSGCVRGIKPNSTWYRKDPNSYSNTIVIPISAGIDTFADGLINILDLNGIGQNYGLKANPQNEINDVNKDGVINYLDYAAVAQSFGKSV